MLKVLIVEDDLMIADMVEETLLAHGFEVCGIARTVKAAARLSQETQPSLVILDFHLADGDLGTSIPQALADGDTVGILYATGNISHLMKLQPKGHACLAKPYSSTDLVRSLNIVQEIATTGSHSLAIPRGLQLLGTADGGAGRDLA